MKNQRLSRGDRARELEEACLKFEKAPFQTYQDSCLIPFYSKMRYGPAINGVDNWGVVKLSGAVKSAWVVMSLTGQRPMAVIQHVFGRTTIHSDCTAFGRADRLYVGIRLSGCRVTTRKYYRLIWCFVEVGRRLPAPTVSR